MLGRFLTRLIDAQSIWSRPLGDFNHRWISALFRPIRPVKDFLHGTWLGHSLHAALTDMPIGILVLVTIFDVLRLSTAADVALLVAVLTLLAAATAGLADYTATDGRARRTATVHSTLMITATVLYVISLVIRAGGPADRTLPTVLAIVGLVLITAGAYVGGEVVFALGNMVDRHAWLRGQAQWVRLEVAEMPEGIPTKGMAGGQPLLLVRQGDRISAMHEVCAHAGGPLSKGRVVDGCIECPWHQSRFQLTDGHRAQGPTTFDQPLYEIRAQADGFEVRRLS